MTKSAAEEKPPKEKKKVPPRIEINNRFCKGCGICVAFCPTQVLGMREGKVVVLKLEACTTCLFCELRCPDFAIAVHPQED